MNADRVLGPWGYSLLATLLVTTLALAQPATRDVGGKDQRTGSEAALQVTAEGDAANRIGDPLFVTVVVKNGSGVDIPLKNFSVFVDASAADRFESDQGCALEQRGELVLRRGSAFEQTCRFAMKPGLPSLMNFGRWQDVLLNTQIRLVAVAEIDPTGELRSYPVVSLRAPEYSIFIGGFAGAMMLALFVLIERVLRNPSTRQQWFRSVVVALVMGLRGGLMALIALLLSKTTQGAGSPVNLTVTDFVGGLLVGLFSYPLATWISATLKLDEGLATDTGQAPLPKSVAQAVQPSDSAARLRAPDEPHPPVAP